MKKLALAIVALVGSAGAQTLQVGTAQVDITPPPGSAMAGYYVPREATGTHDPLHAKAMAFSDGKTEVITVACDLVALPRDVTEAARKILISKVNIPPDHVMISATHSHTSPVILTELTRAEVSGKTLELAKQFTDELPGKIAEAAAEAHAALRPVTMLAGVGEEDTIGFSRRYFMKDGTIGWNPAQLDPNIERPAGPVDRGVPVLYFDDAKTKDPYAAYVNFSVHQDTIAGLIFSADYAYTLSEVMKLAKGKDFFTLFSMGASGNVNHFDPNRPGVRQGFNEAGRIGATLAGEVLKTIQSAKPVTDTTIMVSDKMLTMPCPKYTDAEVAEARRVQATQATGNPLPFLELVKAGRIIDVASRHGKPFDVEVQVFTIGSTAAIVSVPGELFAALGIELKEDSPFPVTIVSELANGGYVYIPNHAGFDEGNYEPTSSRLPEGAGEAIVESAQKQLLDMWKRQMHGQ